MNTPKRSPAGLIGRRVLPYLYIALGFGTLVFMAIGIAPRLAGFLVEYGTAFQIMAVALPALAIATGIVLGGERSPHLEKISDWIYFPALLVFVQVMFSTGRMPGKGWSLDLELPWYTQLDAVGQQSCDVRGQAGWTAVAILVALMVVIGLLRRTRNPNR